MVAIKLIARDNIPHSSKPAMHLREILRLIHVTVIIIIIIIMANQLNVVTGANSNNSNQSGVVSMQITEMEMTPTASRSNFNNSQFHQGYSKAVNSIRDDLPTDFARIELAQSNLSDKILKHRQKRYLLFPEGSSFQMVFDLIIPIVDYTNYAILGITCGVAWELPSKPPSELIENLHTRLKDGTLGTVRRNDTTEGTQPLQYVDKPPAAVPFVKDAYYKKQPKPILPIFDYSATTELPNYYAKSQVATSSSLKPNQAASNGHANPWHTTSEYDNSYWNAPSHWSNSDQYADSYYSREQNNWQAANGGWQQQQQQQREKQPAEWRKYAETDDGYARTAYATNTYYAQPGQRTGRQRKLLQQPPKHRIYPVFGGRKKRSLDDVWDKDLAHIHLREHLNTRARLFRKIEVLYKARALNGTACVLRALCEAGQRHDNDEPQSFIMEMVAAIFRLPKAPDESSEISRHYRAAYEELGNCDQLYKECAHGFWQKS